MAEIQVRTESLQVEYFFGRVTAKLNHIAYA